MHTFWCKGGYNLFSLLETGDCLCAAALNDFLCLFVCQRQTRPTARFSCESLGLGICSKPMLVFHILSHWCNAVVWFYLVRPKGYGLGKLTACCESDCTLTYSNYWSNGSLLLFLHSDCVCFIQLNRSWSVKRSGETKYNIPPPKVMMSWSTPPKDP